MGEDISLYCQNCRGLNSRQKRRDLFQLLRTQKYNIVCLQDVHLENKLEKYIKGEWGYNLYLNGISSNRRGVMILINNNFEQEVGRVIRDQDGNYIIIEITIQGKAIILVNIYGPNEDKPQFYREIKQKVLELENDNVIFCGDWNLVLDQELDTNNYVNINNPRARAVVLDFLVEDSYVDAWRVLNQGKRVFTWRKINPEIKQARLDYFLVSEETFQYVSDCEILPGYRTDHSGVLLTLKLQTTDKGRGYWKFNNSLLKDKEYIKIVKDTISEVKNTYLIKEVQDNNNTGNSMCNSNKDNLNSLNNETDNSNNFNTNDNNNNNNNSNSNNSSNNDNNNNNNYCKYNSEDKYSINDQLLFETLLFMIRGETIKYSARKKKETMKQEKRLEDEIKLFEQNMNDNLSNLTEEEINNWYNMKNSLSEIRQNKIEGTMLRSRCRYENLGEKPTHYFLNLESRNFTNKVMTKLIDENGKERTGTEEILEEQRKYYKNLYKEEIEIEDTPIEEIIGNNPNKLTDVDALKLEGEMTLTELAFALKSMKNSKSPGNDGFSAEFFKFFWKDLGTYVLKSLNYAYKTGSLSVTQKQGIITCIPKQNKSRFLLKNWRPISLLNVVYKMASSVIANRLKSVLQNVIHQDQKGFISGRFIGENVRLIYDILFETKQENIPGLLLSIDFQQAFDSISWKFIKKTLDYYNFGPSFKKWISIFQNGIESSILQNGFLSEFFNLQRGCRQGDPISPYIFILCVEVLGYMIRKNNRIIGVKINGNEFKLSQYADDTQIFLDGSEDSLRQTLNILDKFYLMSGLKINVDKTRAVWIGSMSNSDRKLCKEVSLDWNQNPLKILGVIFTTEVFDIWTHNSDVILHKIEAILKVWSKRKLTLPGRITVIKSLALSKFIHLFLALPNPPGDLVKQLEIRFYKFLWNSGPDRISRKTIIKDITAGGLRMIQLSSFIKALKVSMLRRLITQPNDGVYQNISKIDFSKLFSVGDNYVKVLARDLQNPFWKDTLEAWRDYIKSFKVDALHEILQSPIWYNSNISNNRIVFFKDWYNKGLRSIIDLLKDDGSFYQFDELKLKYNIRGTFLDLFALTNTIPNEWKTKINENKDQIINFKYDVQCNDYVKILIKDKKGSRTIYDLLAKTKEMTVSNKWANELGNITINEWKLYNSSLKNISEIKLRDFQFKINNRILVTNTFLYKIKKIPNNLCSYCQKEAESIFHLFVNCEKTVEFWRSLKTWLWREGSLQLEISNKYILFASPNRKTLINHILIIAKYYIYKTKFTRNTIDFTGFLLYLKSKFQSEMYIANLKNDFDKFAEKWSSLLHYMVRI